MVLDLVTKTRAPNLRAKRLPNASIASEQVFVPGNASSNDSLLLDVLQLLGTLKQFVDAELVCSQGHLQQLMVVAHFPCGSG